MKDVWSDCRVCGQPFPQQLGPGRPRKTCRQCDVGRSKQRRVYAARAENHSGIKIGATYNAAGRIATLGAPSPVCARLRCPGVTGVVFEKIFRGPESLERSLHWAFRRQRIHGEWFDISLAAFEEAVAAFLWIEMITE